jgi:general stress protein 26
MDSINRNQPEDNFKNLYGEEAAEKIKELIKKASSFFFCTRIKTGEPFYTRPMAAEKIDDDGSMWFLSASDSHKNKEIEEDNAVQLLAQGSAYSDYLSLYCTAEISRDKAMIDELWDASMKTWFTEGKDDPRITVIKVTPIEGYYWDTKNGMAVAMIKRVVGAAIGKTFDDSIQGKINP